MARTRTDQLFSRLLAIAERHEDEISNLSYKGPRGGKNSCLIPGWTRSTNNITRAGGLPMMSWWDGSNPTPSTGIPTCCEAEAVQAEADIFGHADNSQSDDK